MLVPVPMQWRLEGVTAAVMIAGIFLASLQQQFDLSSASQILSIEVIVWVAIAQQFLYAARNVVAQQGILYLVESAKEHMGGFLDEQALGHVPVTLWPTVPGKLGCGLSRRVSCSGPASRSSTSS
jgi:hypothetical protein